MERKRVASVSSIQSALNSASKKHDKDFSDEKSGELGKPSKISVTVMIPQLEKSTC